jgi:hypothetical protein
MNVSVAPGKGLFLWKGMDIGEENSRGGRGCVDCGGPSAPGADCRDCFPVETIKKYYDKYRYKQKSTYQRIFDILD